MAVAVGKTEYFKFAGTIKWNHLYEPDEFRGASNYQLDFFPESEAVKQAILDTGVQGAFKADKDTGDEYYRFKRPDSKLIKGEFVTFAPPVIYDAKGKVLVQYADSNGDFVTSARGRNYEFERIGDKVLIGHGSKVIIDVCVYGTNYGPGNRLNSVKIIDLIEYVKSDAGNEDAQSPAESTSSESAGDVDKPKAVKNKAPW